jgi:hypothetical protein
MEASEDGTVLTGKVIGDIVDGQRKEELLEIIARKEGIPLDQVPCPLNEADKRPLQRGMVQTIF